MHTVVNFSKLVLEYSKQQITDKRIMSSVETVRFLVFYFRERKSMSKWGEGRRKSKNHRVHAKLRKQAHHSEIMT